MASSNIFRTTNYGNGENRFRNDNRGSYGTDMSGNRGSYGDNRGSYDRGSYRSSYRNQFSGTVTQQQAPVEVMKPMPPMEEFPSLLKRPVPTKVVEPLKVDDSKPVEAPTSSFAIIAKKAATIVVPKKPEPVVNDEYYEPEAVAYRAPSGRPQMSIQEFIQRREDGQRIEMDDVSICSEYSNCVIDSDSDDDDF
jgi:hypothetical protein